MSVRKASNISRKDTSRKVCSSPRRLRRKLKVARKNRSSFPLKGDLGRRAPLATVATRPASWVSQWTMRLDSVRVRARKMSPVACSSREVEGRGCMEPPWLAQAFPGNTRAQAPEDLVFVLFHQAPGLGASVVVSPQMQDPMDHVADQFGLPGGAMGFGLGQRHLGADEQVAAKVAQVPGVIEGDDIGGAGVVEEGLIDSRHGPRAHQLNAQFE